MLCAILLFSYPMHLYIFVLICQWHVVLLERTNKDIIYIIGFQRQQPTSGGTVRSSDLQIVVNSSFQTVSSTVFRTRVSLQRLS